MDKQAERESGVTPDSFEYRCADCGRTCVSRVGDTFRLASAGTDAGPGKFRVSCPVDPEHRGVVMEEARMVGMQVCVSKGHGPARLQTGGAGAL